MKCSSSLNQVLISSYRDPRCAQTLDNLFKRAKFPERIFVGVVDQRNLERDSFDCLALYCALHAPAPCPYADHVPKAAAHCLKPLEQFKALVKTSIGFRGARKLPTSTLAIWSRLLDFPIRLLITLTGFGHEISCKKGRAVLCTRLDNPCSERNGFRKTRSFCFSV